MDDGSRPPGLILLFLLLSAAYFAVTETSLASVSRNKIKSSADRGSKAAKKVLGLIESFDRAITTLLICTNIVHIATAAIVTAYVIRTWGTGYVSLSTAVTTVAVFFLGEMLPKSIAKKYPEKIVTFCAPLLLLLMKILSPISFVLAKIGNLASRLTKADEETSVTEDELQDIIEDMTEEGSLDEEQSELITSALRFGDVTVESIITPRVDMSAIDISDKPEDIHEFLSSQTHSRIPVYEDSIDNIIGVLQIRKYMKAFVDSGECPDIRPLLDQVHYAHQSTLIDQLLKAMSKEKTNMAVVTDSYGGTLGIVTVEDILEELVGEIWDESDTVEEPVVALADGTWKCDAEVSCADLFDFIGFEDPQDDEKDNNNLQAGEWVYENFPLIPSVGDGFDYHNLHVTVSEMEHNRILSINVEKRETAEEEEVEK